MNKRNQVKKKNEESYDSIIRDSLRRKAGSTTSEQSTKNETDRDEESNSDEETNSDITEESEEETESEEESESKSESESAPKKKKSKGPTKPVIQPNPVAPTKQYPKLLAKLNKPDLPTALNESEGPTAQRLKSIEKFFAAPINLEPLVDLSGNSNSNNKRLTKKTLDIIELINSMNARLRYIKSGTTGHTFKATSKTNPNESYALKVCAYPRIEEYGSIRNPERPENAEIRMLRLLSTFVKDLKTPHFVLPLGVCNASIMPFINIDEKLVDINDKKNRAYKKFIRRYKRGDFENMVSVLISEWINGGDLLDYIRKNYASMNLEMWKVIIFQILHTLSSIHRKYPSFRHNDMKANNILVEFTSNEFSEMEYKYRLGDMGVKFDIPDIGIQIKIWDFDFASIDEVIENNKVNSEWAKKKVGITKLRNQYYDIHFFFNTLMSEKFFPQFYKGGAPKEIVDFFHRVIPKNYRSIDGNQFIREGGRILTNDEFTTPTKLLIEDPLFEKFRFKN